MKKSLLELVLLVLLVLLVVIAFFYGYNKAEKDCLRDFEMSADFEVTEVRANKYGDHYTVYVYAKANWWHNDENVKGDRFGARIEFDEVTDKILDEFVTRPENFEINRLGRISDELLYPSPKPTEPAKLTPNPTKGPRQRPNPDEAPIGGGAISSENFEEPYRPTPRPTSTPTLPTSMSTPTPTPTLPTSMSTPTPTMPVVDPQRPTQTPFPR